MLRVMVFMSFMCITLHDCNKIPSVRKNPLKKLIITIYKTEYKENNSRFCRYAGNKINSAAELGT